MFINIKKIVSVFVIAAIMSSNIFVCNADVEDEQHQADITKDEEKNDDIENLDMVVDESIVINNPTNLWYGMNSEWSPTGIMSELFSEKGGTTGLKVNDAFVDGFKDYNIPIFRMAGTTANNFYWKDAIGKLYNRKGQAPNRWDDDDTLPAGIVEVIKAIRAVNKDAYFSFVVNMHSDTEENIADLAEFLIGDGTININGGENWAKKRIELGIEEPVKNLIFELGNELEYSINLQQREWTKENYTAACRKVIAAIRSVDEDIKVSAILPTAAWSRKSSDWMQWHRYILKEIGDQIDYFSFHSYYSNGQSYIPAQTVTAIAEDIKMYTGSDRIKIFNSEHSISSTTGKKYGYTSLISGLNIAEWFFRMMWNPCYEIATIHAAISSSWSVFYWDRDGRIKQTVYGEILKSFQEYAVGEALYSDLTGFRLDSTAVVSNAVVRQGDNINVLLTNLSEINSYKINMKFNEKYKLVGLRKITGDEFTSMRSEGIDEISVIDEDYETGTSIDSYILDPKTFVVLKMQKVIE